MTVKNVDVLSGQARVGATGGVVEVAIDVVQHGTLPRDLLVIAPVRLVEVDGEMELHPAR